MKSTILTIIMLWCAGCPCLNAQDLDIHAEMPIVRENDVEHVLSSSSALIQHQGERCLYDINSKCIVDRSLNSARYWDGFILTESRVGALWNYHLYSKTLKPIREWKADSSILCASGTVAVRRGSEWTIADVSGSIVYRTSHRIRDACYPLLLLDSADVLLDTRTNEVRMDSVVSIMRWGNGAIVETESNGQIAWIQSIYHWFDCSSERVIELGGSVDRETSNTLHTYDWDNKLFAVFDTNMVVRCLLDRSVKEHNDSVLVARAENGSRWCINDLIRNECQCDYDYVAPDGHGFYIVVDNSMWGVIRYDGKVIVPMCEPVFVDASPKSHLHVVWLPHFCGDDMVAGHITRDKMRTYRYDDNGYYRMFPD